MDFALSPSHQSPTDSAEEAFFLSASPPRRHRLCSAGAVVAARVLEVLPGGMGAGRGSKLQIRRTPSERPGRAPRCAKNC